MRLISLAKAFIVLWATCVLFSMAVRAGALEDQLMSAVERPGNEKVILQLLEEGADINSSEHLFGVTALILAGSRGHIEYVKLLLDRGANVDLATVDGIATLTLAAEYGHTKIVKLLLDKGANVEHVTNGGKTPLTLAAQNGYTEIVKLLLDKGANVDHATSDGDTALILAAEKGHTEIVKLLLDKGANLEHVNNRGKTALIRAAQNGCAETVKLLLDKGAKVDHSKNNDETALMFATLNGHTEAVKLLLDKGAKVDHANRYDITALILAAEKGHTEIVKLLLDKGANLEHVNNRGKTALIRAAQNGCAETVKLLLDKGANVDHSKNNDETALMFATLNGHTEAVKLLLDKGANVDHATSGGNTALTFAAEKGHAKIIKLLLDNGANAEHVTSNGNTALILAAEKGHTDTVKLLLDNDAKVDHANKYNSTALIYAAQNGHTETVKLLLDKGANVEHVTSNGNTALILAALNGHTEAVKLLLDKGANVDHATSDGDTALILAAQNGRAEAVKLLLDKGANIEHVTSHGNNALTLAAQNGRTEIVKLLKNSWASPLIRAIDREDLDAISAFLKKNKSRLRTKKSFFNLYRDQDGNTPLAIAIKTGKIKAAAHLIKLGADRFAKNKQGDTVLKLLQMQYDKLSFEEYQARIRLFFSDAKLNQFSEKLWRSALNGNKDNVERLLVNGANIEYTNGTVSTSLLCAAENGHTEIVKLLLDKGANVERANISGGTALIYAAQNGHTEIVKLLLDKGANVERANINGGTALTFAAEKGHAEIVKLLLDRGAKVDHANNYYSTALIYAAQNGHTEIVKLLLDKGANVERANINGGTALTLAAEKGHAEIVKLLLDRGAKVDHANNYDSTALIYAAQNGHTKIVKLLLDKCANINHVNNKSWTALTLASQKGHSKIVTILTNHLKRQLPSSKSSQQSVTTSSEDHANTTYVDFMSFKNPIIKPSQAQHSFVFKKPDVGVGAYEVLLAYPLGKGALGEVFLGFIGANPKYPVVVKLALKPEYNSVLEQSHKLNEEALDKIKNATWIVEPTSPVDTSNGRGYYLMKWTDGVPLSLFKPKTSHSLSPAEALNILGQLVAAIEEHHKAGILHGDIKPSNIMIDRSGNIRIIDFGGKPKEQTPDLSSVQHSQLSIVTGSPDSETTSLQKTENYQSDPDEIPHHLPESEHYTLAYVFYKTITGKLPSLRMNKPSTLLSTNLFKDEKLKWEQAGIKLSDLDKIFELLLHSKGCESLHDALILIKNLYDKTDKNINTPEKVAVMAKEFHEMAEKHYSHAFKHKLGQDAHQNVQSSESVTATNATSNLNLESDHLLTDHKEITESTTNNELAAQKISPQSSESNTLSSRPPIYKLLQTQQEPSTNTSIRLPIQQAVAEAREIELERLKQIAARVEQGIVDAEDRYPTSDLNSDEEGGDSSICTEHLTSN